MGFSKDFIDGIDHPEWKPLASAPASGVAGVSIAGDYRNDDSSDPFIYQLGSNTGLYRFHVKNDEWAYMGSPVLTGTFGAGADCVFVPHLGPAGALASSGNSASAIVISTALPGPVAANALANRGDGEGYKIRIIGNNSGGSGKIEERTIIGNTAGSTPTLYLDAPLSFTPNSAAYELLSGRLYVLGASTVTAGIWKYYDVATMMPSSNLATTNLPTTISTDSQLISLSEQYVPYNRKPGEGFVIGASTYDTTVPKGCLVATATAAGTITGQASAGDATVLLNQYRNYQIRIVEDTAVPTAVGQRRRITSHTVGPSVVYTLASNWTVTPSANAKFVIEMDGDKIILFTSGVATTYNYNIAGNTWDTSTWAARGNAVGAGVTGDIAFSIQPDANNLVRQSMIFSLRGGANNALDVLDIAGAATGSWTNTADYGGGKGFSITTGTFGCMEPCSMQGRYLYFNYNGTNRVYRFDMLTRTFEPYANFPNSQGTSVVGGGIASGVATDGTDKIGIIYLLRRSNPDFYMLIVQR